MTRLVVIDAMPNDPGNPLMMDYTDPTSSWDGETRRLYSQPHLAPAMSNAAVVAAENTPAEPFAPPAPKAARETAVAAAKVGADSESPAEPAKSPSNESGRGRWVALGAILLACVGVAFALGRRSGQR